MTIKEYSDQFDTLLDSYKMPNGYGADETPVVVKLDEYEKSVFLSDAQTDLVVELYSGKNMYGGYFDSSEELRRYLSTLIRGGYGIMSSTSITLLNNA
jgi:hypothetical protein